MNLYIYISPNSAHQPGILKSLIFGQLQQYWYQNSNKEDYKKTATLFFERLRNRGHKTDTLTKLFNETVLKIDTTSTTKRKKKEIAKTLFIHQEYHPDCPPTHKIHKIFEETCKPVKQK